MRSVSEDGPGGRDPVDGERPFTYVRVPGAVHQTAERRRGWASPGEARSREREVYPGEAVLRDLSPGLAEDGPLILARFATARCVCLALDGAPPSSMGPDIVGALGYVRAAERIAGAEALALATAAREAPYGGFKLAAALERAADHAARRGHGAGAAALLRLRYELALRDRAWQDAHAAALRLATLARAGCATACEARWRRRAVVLQGRLASPPAGD